MKMKYFQGIADILTHYDNIEREFNSTGKFSLSLLESWDIKESDREDLLEEREVLRYLIACQLGFSRVENVLKPSIALVERTFNRHLAFLEKILGIHAYNVNKYDNSHTRREYKTCRHYLFKFSLPAWYDELPIAILAYENRKRRV